MRGVDRLVGHDGIGTPARTRFSPSQSHEGTGCSQSSIRAGRSPAGAHRVGRGPSLVGVDADPDVGPDRLTDGGEARSSISGDSPIFTLTTRNPAATASSARPAIVSGAST